MGKKYVARAALGDGLGDISHRSGNILEEGDLPKERFQRFVETGALVPATDEDIARAMVPDPPAPVEDGPSMQERLLDLEARVDVLEAASNPAAPEEGKKK